MRDFTKSSFSFSWSMSLLGLQQLGNLFAPRDSKRPWSQVTETFDRVTRAMEGQLGETLRETFRAGDKLQRGMVDLMFRTLDGPGTGSASWSQRMSGCGRCRRPEWKSNEEPPWQADWEATEATPGWADNPPPAATDEGRRDEAGGWGPIPAPDEVTNPGGQP